MSWEKCFEELMPDTVIITNRSTSATPSLSGAPTWATTSSTYTARVVRAPRVVNQNDGSVVAITSVVYMASTSMIDPRDRIELPDGSKPPIVGIWGYPDEDGLHHLKIELGR